MSDKLSKSHFSLYHYLHWYWKGKSVILWVFCCFICMSMSEMQECFRICVFKFIYCIHSHIWINKWMVFYFMFACTCVIIYMLFAHICLCNWLYVIMYMFILGGSFTLIGIYHFPSHVCYISFLFFHSTRLYFFFTYVFSHVYCNVEEMLPHFPSKSFCFCQISHYAIYFEVSYDFKEMLCLNFIFPKMIYTWLSHSPLTLFLLF